MTRSIAVLLIGLVFALGAVPLTAQKIDLVELKKKEEERRKKLEESGKEPIKVTEETLKQYSSGPDRSSGKKTTTPEEQTREDQGKKSEKEAEKDPRKNREYWQQRAGLLRDRISELKKLIEEKDEEIRKLTLQYNLIDEFFQRNRLNSGIQEATRLRDEYRESLVLAEKKLVDLEAEARKLYIPPGWLR